nr:MAG TPA: hypothetical protein [Caudoviricetes sp.]
MLFHVCIYLIYIQIVKNFHKYLFRFFTFIKHI